MILLLENILGMPNINPLRYEGFKDYPLPFKDDSKESLPEDFIPLVYAKASDYETYEIPAEEVNIPKYFSLTESIRASFKPSYSNYLQDMMSKKVEFVNMPDISAYGWTFPNDHEASITINTAYANTQSKVDSTINHERVHEQTITYHEPPMLHEQRTRLTSDTSYFS